MVEEDKSSWNPALQGRLNVTELLGGPGGHSPFDFMLHVIVVFIESLPLAIVMLLMHVFTPMWMPNL